MSERALRPCKQALMPVILGLLFFGCHPVTLKTLDLQPVDIKTGLTGIAGSHGWCFSAGNPPPSPFSAGAGEVLVGFDDYFKPGSNPFPCDDIRVAVFRGGVRFDVSQFDSIVSADFIFDVSRSISRTGGGETVGTVPGKSFATVLGLATQPFTSAMPYDDEASMPTDSSIDLAVATQVRSWVDKSHGNFGFVIAGPRDFNPSSPAEDNDASLSFYRDFKLRIIYNPAQNPRAPQ
jgi:hypothetical protein